MKCSVSTLILGFLIALSAAAPTPDTDGLNPSQVFITGITYGGTSCKPGSAAISHSPDFQTFNVIFEDYEATIKDSNKNCNLNVQLHYPPGYQFTLYKANFTGYAQLEKGVTAKQQSSYWFPSLVNNKATFHLSLDGPYDNNYAFTDTLASEAILWSPCGASTTLNINTQVAVISTNPNAQGLIKIKNQNPYGVNWRKCN